jgi:hypothetical protein
MAPAARKGVVDGALGRVQRLQQPSVRRRALVATTVEMLRILR